jgi:hypothetical protein
MSPNNHMQRPGNHKVLGRGRGRAAAKIVRCARVLRCQRAGADVGRYAALLRLVSTPTLLLLGIGLAYAISPIHEVVITPKDANALDVVVVVDRFKDSTMLKLLAPPLANGDCTPIASGMELRDSNGKILLSQDALMASNKEGPEIRGLFYPPAGALTLWVNYICPSSHANDSVRYVIKSQDWVSSGTHQ